MKKIKSLDETLNNIQINRFLDKAEKELNKITKRLRKQVLITIIPMLVIIINAFILQNFYIMLLGLFGVSGIGIVAGVKDLIKSVRGKNSKEEIYLDNLKFTKVDPEEYYTLEYKRVIENYTPTVEDNLEVIDNSFLNKEAVITIDNFIANIDILKSYGLSDDDIEYVKDELSLDLKVVDFNTLVRKNKRDISRH